MFDTMRSWAVSRRLRAQGMKLLEHMVDQNEREVLVSVALQELGANGRRKRKA